MSKIFVENEIDIPIDVSKIITIYKTNFYSDRPFLDKEEEHDFYELVVVEAGEYFISVNDEPAVSLLPSEVILLSPNVRHGITKPITLKNDVLIYIICFKTTKKIDADIFNRPIKLSSSQRTLLSQLFSDAFLLERKDVKSNSYQGMTFVNNNNPYALQKIKNRLELFLIGLCEFSSADSPIRTSNRQNIFDTDHIKVTSFLRNNITRSLTVAEIADGCLMSVAKLKKLFSTNNLGGVINYFNSLKIAEAKHMILNYDMTFTEISEHLGFVHPHYFSRLFKQKTGCSPSQYASTFCKSKENH